VTPFGRRGLPINAKVAGRWGDQLLTVAESAIYVLVAVLLAAAAFAAVARAFVELLRSVWLDQAQAMLTVLDELLLVFIFVELLFAVRVTLKERHASVEPFLIAGILASIKEIIVLSVKAANNYIDQGPEFARAMVGVGVLGLVVLALTFSVIMLRRARGNPHGVPPTPAPSEIATPKSVRATGPDPD
jgi:uncharacterized membrane protein (DUF373 family)